MSDEQLQSVSEQVEVVSRIQLDLQKAVRYGNEVGDFRPLGPKQPFFLDLTQIQTDGASTMPEGNVSKKQPGRPRNHTESENG